MSRPQSRWSCVTLSITLLNAAFCLTSESVGDPGTQVGTSKVRVASISFEPKELDVQSNSRDLEQMVRQAAADGGQLAVAPGRIQEGYVINDILAGKISPQELRDAALSIDAPIVQRCLSLANELRTCIEFGFAEHIGDEAFNCAFSIDDTGESLVVDQGEIAEVGNTSHRSTSNAAVKPTLLAEDEREVTWFDVQDIGVEGKAWNDTEAFYDRLPSRAQSIVRPPVWSLSQDSAGMCVHFESDATSLHARWALRDANLAMPHMPATGVSGVDLYVRFEGTWRWLATGRPTAQTNTAYLVHDLPPVRREYLLYLPLYNGVSKIEIGTNRTAQLWRARWPDDRKPIVFWGTSITQGGCASRPGMVHTAILGRRLGYPVVNLGFSGNGRMEHEVTELVAEIDASVYVIDCLPNVTADVVTARTRPLVETIRGQRPDVPILLVEDRTYADAFLVQSRRTRNESSRVALRQAFEAMQSDGIPLLYYLEGDTLLGPDGEDTVDGSHPTDLGFMRQADAFEKALRPLLTDHSNHVP